MYGLFPWPCFRRFDSYLVWYTRGSLSYSAKLLACRRASYASFRSRARKVVKESVRQGASDDLPSDGPESMRWADDGRLMVGSSLSTMVWSYKVELPGIEHYDIESGSRAPSTQY